MQFVSIIVIPSCSLILVIKLLFFLVNIQVFLENKYPSSIMLNKFFFEIYKLCKNFLQKNEDNCYLRFIKSNSFQRKDTDMCWKNLFCNVLGWWIPKLNSAKLSLLLSVRQASGEYFKRDSANDMAKLKLSLC